MTTADATIKLRELVGDQRVAFLTTSAQNGELHARPLTLADIDDQGNMLFLVDANADWVQGIGFNESVNLSIANADDKTWVSVAGTAMVGVDRAAIHRLWSPEASAFLAGDADGPFVRLLTVMPSSAEYWDAPSTRIARLAVMARAALGDKSAKMGESGSIDLS